MKHWIVAAALGCLVGIFGYAPAFAWGPTGHRAVGAVADDLLSDAAKQQVAVLLADDRNAAGNPSGRRTLAEVAVWADEIRSTSANRPLWHYDDAPACGDIPSRAAWCPNGNCASAKVQELSKVLVDTSRPIQERNEALKWIVHLVGDIHQPLHAASNVYETGLTDDLGNDHDRGGNDISVALAGTKTRGAKSLHGVWDNDLVNLTFGQSVSNRKPLPPGQLQQLVSKARSIPDDALGSNVEDWVADSNRLARTAAYHFPDFRCYEPLDEIVVLSPAYQSDAKDTIRDQLAVAGARLAKLLNNLLK